MYIYPGNAGDLSRDDLRVVVNMLLEGVFAQIGDGPALRMQWCQEQSAAGWEDGVHFQIERRGPVGSVWRHVTEPLDVELIQEDIESGGSQRYGPTLIESLRIGHHWCVTVGGMQEERDLMLWTVTSAVAGLTHGIVHSWEAIKPWLEPVPAAHVEWRSRLLRGNGDTLPTDARQYLDLVAEEFQRD